MTTKTTRRSPRATVVIDLLLEQPARILDAQRKHTAADRAYQARLAEVTITAFDLPLFKGKDGAPRPAANDIERSAAIDYAVRQDERLTALAAQREAAYAQLAFERNRLEGAMRAARLLIQSAE